jgi:pyridoxamine 5'-phosphate oxidase
VGSPLEPPSLAATWHDSLTAWVADAVEAGLPEPTAMVLATADGSGVPSARTVLMRDHDADGLVFYTNYESRKGRELGANPRAAAVFPWYPLHRQVVVHGSVELVDAVTSDAYFATRPYGAQVGAHASPQSAALSGRSELERLWEEAAQRFPPDRPVPRPASWGGYRLRPVTVEFWTGRPDRLHDRLRFTLASGVWALERLAP